MPEQLALDYKLLTTNYTMPESVEQRYIASTAPVSCDLSEQLTPARNARMGKPVTNGQ